MYEEEKAVNSDSILSSVKQLIGVPVEETAFDLDIMLNINAALSTLFQIGVLPKPCTISSDKDTYFSVFPEADESVLSQVKMYLVYKTKLSFDSPSSTGAVLDVLKELIREAEWRLMVSFNPDNTFE